MKKGGDKQLTAQEIKNYIYENGLVEDVLSDIGCHHIKKHSGFWTAGNHDGDNNSAIVVYDNENLTTINYTRQIVKQERTTDLFDLVSFSMGYTFPESLRFLCNAFGLDYYSEPEDVPESLQILKMLKDMSIGGDSDDSIPLKPISEDILNYYINKPNKMFEDDNISLNIQKEFKIGYDASSNRITIPIRDALGTLIGVKGRLFGAPDENNPKYLYLENCSKSRVLYGYYENQKYIKENNIIYCLESEKAVLQLASYGIRNAVSFGGKSISKTQAELLIRTGATPCLALDKDVGIDEIKSILSIFPSNLPVYYIYDVDDILDEKQSPSDDHQKFLKLIKNNIYKFERND